MRTLVEDGDRDLVVVTRSGKVVVGDMEGNDEAQAHEEDKGIEEEEILIQQSIAKESQKDLEKINTISKRVQPLPKIPPPFTQRLKKKNEDEGFKKFLSMFKTLSINLLLLEALFEMLGYAKFMKELVTKNRSLDFETIEVSHSSSTIMPNEMIK
uniref:mRNA expressed from retrotransposon-like gene n=1 Tax=Solanum tuberosum TaxID=4113 RepID=M1DCC9_SOLTU